MNLFNLKKEYVQALDAMQVDELTGEITGFEAVQAIQDDINNKLLNYGKYIKTLNAEIAAFKQEKQRVDNEVKRRLKKVDYLKEAIKANLDEGATLSDSQCKLGYRNAERVEVTDINLLPCEYLEYTPKVNKSALKQALKDNQVDGALLETVSHLQIN